MGMCRLVVIEFVLFTTPNGESIFSHNPLSAPNTRLTRARVCLSADNYRNGHANVSLREGHTGMTAIICEGQSLFLSIWTTVFAAPFVDSLNVPSFMPGHDNVHRC